MAGEDVALVWSLPTKLVSQFQGQLCLAQPGCCAARKHKWLYCLAGRAPASFVSLPYPVVIPIRVDTELLHHTWLFTLGLTLSSASLQTWLICPFTITTAPAVPPIRTLWLRSHTQEPHPGLWLSRISIHRLTLTTPTPASLTQATATEGAVRAASTVKVSEKDQKRAFAGRCLVQYRVTAGKDCSFRQTPVRGGSQRKSLYLGASQEGYGTQRESRDCASWWLCCSVP